jgi:hypothetical protein
MDTAIILDETHYHAAVERARTLGTTPQAYVQTLIDHAGRSLDEILDPISKGFASMSDDELDALFDRAIKYARSDVEPRS